MTLPYSRTVNVTVSRTGGSPTRRGFGVLLFLTTEEKAGKLDASNLTRVYGSPEEVAVDWLVTDEFYKASQAAFSQNPRPVQVKAGFLSAAAGAEHTDAELTAALVAISDADSAWYWLTIEAGLRDIDGLDGIVNWTETNNKQAMIGTNDALHKTAADTTCISARHKNTVERTSTWYHDQAGEYLDVAAAARFSTYNFDDAESAYTAKYKNLATIPAVEVGSSAVQSITGFTPQLGQSVGAGHMANTYVDIGGKNFITEGSTLTPNVFIDEIHATDWIIARTEEEVLQLLLKNDRVPFTDQGMQLLASAPRTVMEIARSAGFVSEDINPETGDFESSVEVSIPSVLELTESQRKNRIAPAIAIKFRYAGAAHYTTINYNITF